MTVAAAVLSSRSSFVLAALVASWLAVVLLALVAANLHFRLVRLERTQPAAAQVRTPFRHLLGRNLTDVLGPDALGGTRLALILSANCATCDRLMEWLRDSTTSVPVALLWRDGTPSPLPALPTGAVVVQDGARVSSTLGIRVTPFALAADEVGQVVRALPIGTIDAFASILHDLGNSTTRNNHTEHLPASPLVPATPTPLRGVAR